MSIGLKNQSGVSTPEPASGETSLFIDSVDGKLKRKIPGGSIVNIEDGGSISADGVSFTPGGDIIATDVQAAIEELDTEKAPSSHVGSGGVSRARTSNRSRGRFLSPSDKTKLDTVENGATANESDSFLLNRANHTGAQNSSTISDFDTSVDDRINLQKGFANGLATLDGGGKIPSSELPNNVSQFLGGWNAATNIPSLVDGVGNAGDHYTVTSPGSVDFGSGLIQFLVGHVVNYTGTVWQRWGQVTTKSDVGLGNVDNTSDLDKPVSTAQASADSAVQAFSIQRSNHTGTQLSGTISDFTEAAQDAVGSSLVDSPTIDFTYDDALNQIVAILKLLSVDDSHIANAANIALSKLASLAAPTEQYRPVIAGDTIQEAINKILYTSGLSYHEINEDINLPSGMEFIRGKTRVNGTTSIRVQGTSRLRFI